MRQMPIILATHGYDKWSNKTTSKPLFVFNFPNNNPG